MDPSKEVWLERSVGCVTFCITIYILKREYQNRRNSNNTKQNNNDNPSKFQKRLTIWSILTIIFAILTSLFWFIGSVFSKICRYGIILGNIFGSNARIILTFYQISRLQYCFY